ncbi:MAG TPA: T9SS type A sorting domain-containing protein [Bacteroidales bacterium]|nr:T9SS type A sorting domain-containing protein [Bacteroidales bacterium]
MHFNKLYLTLLLVIVNITSFSQLNPINDLNFQHTYWYGNSFCPSYNCFTLSWSPPDISSDTLVGYNVYKDEVLWLFTVDCQIDCQGIGPCDYPDFYNNYPFWIKVKSVYNTANVESVANDSIFMNDLYTNIDEINVLEFVLLQNPIVAGENISLLLPIHEQYLCSVKLFNLYGQLLKDFKISNSPYSILTFSSTNLPAGVYIIDVEIDGQLTSRKLVIE